LPESEPPQLQIGARMPMSSAPDGRAETVIAPTLPSPASEGARTELQAELSEAVKKETGSTHSPRVNVEQTGEGVMISLTDDADFGMFGIGSATPQPQLVRIMERVATILKARSGSIVIRGHTDARPFRSGNYDNWRLSTDRAQMAYYMLVRGGLDEKRVAAIEGYADRKPKVPSNPEAAENRRIEILLQEATQ
jgi:chemotaxis protein MotB